MSILFNRLMMLLSDVLSLFLPRTCACCGKRLVEAEHFICTRCRRDAPLTQMWRETDNEFKEKFYSVLCVERASAMLWYGRHSRWRDVIHSLKYRNRWITALRMGEWYGYQMMDDGVLRDVNVIVPVPLHWRKRVRRGYNQAEYIALGISRVTGIPVDFRSVVRAHDNPSQTHQSRYGRWENVSNIFKVRRPDRLHGRRILLVDDVCTTGATISSCAIAIAEACDGEVAIDVAALATPLPSVLR